MIPLDAARAHVLAACPRLEPRSVPLAEAVGLVAAESIVAASPVPAFANSAMDGFAVRAADVAGAGPGASVRLAVIDTVTAGAVPAVPVGPGTAVRIMTGAPIPDGADAIVVVEETRPAAGTGGDGHGDVDDVEEVDVLGPVASGDNIRPAGGDAQVGDAVVPAGTRLRAAHLGVLASVGRSEIVVVPRPRVGVVSTGDELVAPGRPLGPGQIHDSNRPMLLALVAATGATPIDLGHVPDDEERLEAVLRAGAVGCDVIVSSGGVSMGDADVVKLVLGRIAAMQWMQIAIRPAKPFALGVLDGTPVIGLPGNPVSSLVSFELLARPGIRSRGGRADLDRPRVRARLATEVRRRPDGKTHLLRVVLQRDGAGPPMARPAESQGSHQLSASAGADGLAVVPDGDGLPAGAEVDVVVIDDDDWMATT